MKRALIILIAAMIVFLTTAHAAVPSANEEVIPFIEMRDVPLTEALQQLARKARLNVILDPRLSQAPYSTTTVSVRWEKVTAQEALIALLENHGLALVHAPRPQTHSLRRD
jgi:hypothetical protein